MMHIKQALVCAPTMPEFDREGGSRRIFHLIEFLQQAGWTVSFVAEYAAGGERYAKILQQKGIRTYAVYDPWLNGQNALTDMELLIHGGKFDLVLFAFWSCAEPYIPMIRSLSPATTIVVDSVDVHFLRKSRSVFSGLPRNGQPRALDADYASEMTGELNVYAASDAVLTVSRKEAELINDFLGRQIVYDIPDTEEIAASPVAFADRHGMLFVGNFRHPPNVQAVEYLCREILPKVPPAILQKHPVYIVGNAPNETVVRCSVDSKNVRLVGWVPSVTPYLQHVRLSLIPLLYGAGTKRKLMQSLMAGTPSVSTRIGIEGFGLVHNEHVFVADDASAFAAGIARLIRDEQLWRRIADEGRVYVRRIHSRQAVFSRFISVLGDIMNPAVSASIFCEELQPGHSTSFDCDLDRTVTQEVLGSRKLKGFCNVSASETEFTVTTDNLREDIVSTVSSSSNRNRQLVCALSMALFGRPHVSLDQISAYANQNDFRAYIAETNSALSDSLKRHLKPDLLVRSEYLGTAYQSGEVVHGTLHQDLQSTSFVDDTFDIIITSDVFEHIPNAIAAEREVMRILKPGGVYCFTAPFLPAHDHDVVLAEVDNSGNTRYLAEPQYHVDPLRPEGILVYRIFSFNDMKRRFESMGHEFKSYRFWSKSLGILGSDCWAHTVKKAAVLSSNVLENLS